MSPNRIPLDGNQAAAHVAYRGNEVIAIYPITPASPMGEHADAWSAQRVLNLWGTVPRVVEMQSEAGAAGTLHGALQAGCLATTFTASQGLLLMLPNMYKIAGELLPCVIHVAARTVATHALSIFGDHSDVMAARQTGFAMLASANVQEAMDFALVAQAATLRSRIPFLHFFDGFRTSHEIAKIEVLDDSVIKDLIDAEAVAAHRQRALSPDHPVIRGTAQNPDVFFQCREAINPYYTLCPKIVQEVFDALARQVGRAYRIFDYHGHPEAERVIVLMGSGTETAHETVDHLVSRGEPVGVLKVRLYRPFDAASMVAALPRSVQALAVLDRTKEPGSPGEPLYQDVVTAVMEHGAPHFPELPSVVGGRYGLSSKEFNPAMVRAVFENLRREVPVNHFTVGIRDDVTDTSLDFDPEFSLESPDTTRALFYGLGADGTVGANKNSIKIIGETTDLHVQGYFVYDSRKAGSVTVSHLRFGPHPIRSSYLIESANFIGCHQFSFLETYDMTAKAAPEATLLLNSPYSADTVWDRIPSEVQRRILDRRLKLYVIDAYTVAREAGLGVRINTIMQTCFFALCGILPRDEAIAAIKRAIEETYASKGEKVLAMNYQAVDRALSNLHPVTVPEKVTGSPRPAPVPQHAPDFVQRVTGMMLAGQGDLLPVSAFPPDGTWPTGTSQWEKRNIAQTIPIWDPQVCIQCNKCAMVCPHAAIRAKVFEPAAVENAPESFITREYKGPEHPGMRYRIQVAPEDCTGCGVCVDVCPARDKARPKFKAINMQPHAEHVDLERAHYDFFLNLPDPDRTQVHVDSVKDSQFLRPLFEYSGACAGCGETPYLKLLSQCFGDRLLIANATGCSSIYGGNLPTTPWAVNADGRGPAWANSLFEDNAEFGLGFRLAVDHLTGQARLLLEQLSGNFGTDRVRAILDAPQVTERELADQRRRVEELKRFLQTRSDHTAQTLLALADYLVNKSVWIVGGDGWAYDIGFGGLDHVLNSGANVNVLVLDTMVYSNTGGQMSKSTPFGAVAKFAANGKDVPRKNLGLVALSYGHVYVAQVAMGARDIQTVRAFQEAERFPGPSLVIAYSQCIAHGINMTHGMQNQQAAVDSGFWPLYRFNPEVVAQGKNPLHLDSKAPRRSFKQFADLENRFVMLKKMDPERWKQLLDAAQLEINQQWDYLEKLAALDYSKPGA